MNGQIVPRMPEDLSFMRPVTLDDESLELVAWRVEYGRDAEAQRDAWFVRLIYRHPNGRAVLGEAGRWHDTRTAAREAAIEAFRTLQAEDRGERVRRLRCSCGAGLGERHEGGCPALAVAP